MTVARLFCTGLLIYAAVWMESKVAMALLLWLMALANETASSSVRALQRTHLLAATNWPHVEAFAKPDGRDLTGATP